MRTNNDSEFTRGFLPAKDPLKKLPDKFAEWEDVASRLPKLLVSNYLRDTIQNMSLITTDDLLESAEIERAMLLLSFFGHAYVWGSKTPADKIPMSLAQPWCEIAHKLQRPPVLSYASYALHNWQRIDDDKAIELGNIALLQNFFGGLDEEWFVLVHVDIENKASVAINSFLRAQQSAQKNATEELLNSLKKIKSALEQMCQTLDRMPEGCDPYIYYNRVRPYIHGWKDNPALPGGIIYEGVQQFHNKPQRFRGETGAQSSIIPCLDAVFGITHEDDPLRQYLQEMRDYMPRMHREFLQKLEHQASIREFVAENRNKFPELLEYYNNCIELIFRFRETHLHYAATYIHKQAQTSLANPTAKGTGGTPFMVYLKKHRDETKKFLL